MITSLLQLAPCNILRLFCCESRFIHLSLNRLASVTSECSFQDFSSTEPTARHETATVAHAVSSLPEVRQTKAKAVNTRQAARLQELESLPEHLPAVSFLNLYHSKTEPAAHSGAHMHHSRQHGLLQHVKLKALIEHKCLKLQGLQQKLRNDVALEQRLLKDCSPSVLMDWTRCKRADPEAAEPNMNYKEPAPPASLVPKPSQAAQIEIAR